MARIRTVKPEFWTDEKVGAVSVSARLLLIGALNFADDYGGLDRSAKQLKAQVFPYDDIDCEPLVLELIRVGLFIEYEVGERKYLHIKGFSVHQKVENKAKRRIPEYQQSPNTHQVLTEDSQSPHSLREGKGRESSGEEGISARGVTEYGDALTKTPADPPDESSWIEIGCDPDAMREWVTHRAKNGKALPGHAQTVAAKLLLAIGPADVQRRAVQTAIANNWQSLRPTDGQTKTPKHSRELTWRPDGPN